MYLYMNLGKSYMGVLVFYFYFGKYSVSLKLFTNTLLKQKTKKHLKIQVNKQLLTP